MITRFVLASSVIFLSIACTVKAGKSGNDNSHLRNGQIPEFEDGVDTLDLNFSSDTTLQIAFRQNTVEVKILMPEVPTATIVALPGWNFPNTGWCDSTSLCEEALKRGYVLILPQMGKSIYCDTTFPETRKDWLKYPTRDWVTSTMIPQLQKMGLLAPEDPNYILGLSTGARGAVLIALDEPDIFKGCAALSGDYDQTQFPTDNLYRGYYGSLKQFPDRWKNNDNAITTLEELEVPLYIGHGRNDNIVPIKHSEILVEAMERKSKAYIFHADSTATHNYSYWNSEVDNMLDFFEKKLDDKIPFRD